ncbi:MAG: Gfo/Idh/MocA family oxidoreductase [Planctomycetales bacterium]|nr:Gfo/Idh/MocA family oxidoreductase [Planctomycetales bacterium]
MPKKPNRRTFIKTSTAAGAGVGYWAAGGVSLAQSTSPNEQIQFASIGVGGKGRSDSSDAGRAGKMVAICDVDARTLEQAQKGFKDAQPFRDYRRMLDEMGDKIDAVTVSTPDHNHAPAAVRAMKLKKHCFCQKPLSQSIFEARTMGQVAKEQGVQTMMGNQGTALSSLREAVAVIKTGILGTITECHVWTNRPVWPQGIERPTEIKGNPNHLHWDEWIGPAPYRPYHDAYHPFNWRGWWDFGTGALGDMACHTMNMPYMALQLRDPKSVVARSSGHNRETYPAWSIIDFDFPALGDRGAIKFTWYDGGKKPPTELFQGKNIVGSGCLVVGDKGTLYSQGDYADSFELLNDLKKPEVEFEKSPGHFQEWVRAIKTGQTATSNFPNYAGPLTETLLLGNLAVYAADSGEGKKIEWDAETMTPTNAPELASIVKREYREGYEL